MFLSLLELFRRPIMRRFLALFSTIAALAVSLAFIASPAHAQATRTWVSGVGDDGNACSRTAPCKTFAGAIAKTTVNGEINCLDPGGFGNVTITKSITIDCHEMVGTILNAGIDGIDITFDLFGQSDTLKTVNLRSLSIQGAGANGVGISIVGAGPGSFVDIEDCLVGGSTGTGIADGRSRGALVVNNTIVRNVPVGISISSPNGGSRRALISDTHIINSGFGIIVGADTNVVVSHSVLSNSASVGVQVLSSSSFVDIDSTTIAHNGIGIQNSGTVEISNSNFTLNTTAVSGSVSSFSNNRFIRNTTLGTIIPVGTTSNPTGQQ
jgi:parallel beta helix pectate lyase-like protein